MSPQLIDQGLSLLQIQRVEALGEPAIHRGEKVAGLLVFARMAPQPGHAHRRAQLSENIQVESSLAKRSAYSAMPSDASHSAIGDTDFPLVGHATF
jgi:hypothetical protein